MVPYTYKMVDMKGVDLAYANGSVVEGIYQSVLDSINTCGVVVLYNWKFADIEIVPTHVDTIVSEDETITINNIIVIGSDDTVSISGIIPPPADPTIIPLDAHENREYLVPEGVDGFNPVSVDVSCTKILSGPSEPTSAQGGDGDMFLHYFDAGAYPNLLEPQYLNLNNWTKNSAAFTQFDNTYANDENTLIQTGGNGYERIFAPFSCEPNTNYNLILLYYSPTGVASGYSGQLNVKVTDTEDLNGSAPSISYIAMQNLNLTVQSEYTAYNLSFNSGDHTQLYLCIDLNITDGRQCTLKFKKFYVGQGSSVAEQGEILNAYLKVNGAWQNLIGSNIDDVDTQ